jgi:hypothetical protein
LRLATDTPVRKQQLEQRFAFPDLAGCTALESHPADQRSEQAQTGGNTQRDASGRDRVHAIGGEPLRHATQQQHCERRAESLAEPGDAGHQTARFFLGRIGEHSREHRADRGNADGKKQRAAEQLRESPCQRVEKEPRRKPDETQRVNGPPTDLVGQCAERCHEQQREDFVAEAEHADSATLHVLGNLQIRIQQVGLNEADEGEHADGDEGSEQVGRRVHAGVPGRQAHRTEAPVRIVQRGAHQGTGLARSATENA